MKPVQNTIVPQPSKKQFRTAAEEMMLLHTEYMRYRLEDYYNVRRVGQYRYPTDVQSNNDTI